jgi:hypothetical protein
MLQKYRATCEGEQHVLKEFGAKICFPICLPPQSVVNILMLSVTASPTAKRFLLTNVTLALQVTGGILMAWYQFLKRSMQ